MEDIEVAQPALTGNVSSPLPHPISAAIPSKAARTLVERPKSGWPAASPRKKLPPWDRSIDVIYHKHRCGRALPDNAIGFGESVATFFADHGRIQESASTSRYLRLPASARFKICQHIIADHSADMSICLTDGRYMRDVWSDDEYTSLASTLGPLQPYLDASFALRADMMIAFLMTERFHVTFSPFVGARLNPTATLWCNKYGHFMGRIVLELDLTRLGFGPGKQACKLQAGTVNMKKLIDAFVETQLKRQMPLKSLVLLCRRFYGQRPSSDVSMGVEAEPSADGKIRQTKPEQAIVVNGSYTDFSYCPDEFLRTCEPIIRLEGLIDSMRLCGFSDDYTNSLLTRIFSVPGDQETIKHHSYRVAPSSVWPRVPGQSSWIDTGHGRLRLDDHSREYLHGLYFPEGAIMLPQPYEDPLTGLMSIGSLSCYTEEASRDSDMCERPDSCAQLIRSEAKEFTVSDAESLENKMKGLMHRIRRSMSKRETGVQAKTSFDWISLVRTWPDSEQARWTMDSYPERPSE